MRKILTLLFFVGICCSFNLASQNEVNLLGDAGNMDDRGLWDYEFGLNTFNWGDGNTQLVWGDEGGDRTQGYKPKGFESGGFLTVCEGWGEVRYLICKKVEGISANTTYTVSFDYNIGDNSIAKLKIYLGKTEPVEGSDYTENQIGDSKINGGWWQGGIGDDKFFNNFTLAEDQINEDGISYFVIKWECAWPGESGYFNTSIDNVSLVASSDPPTPASKFPVTLQVIDQTKGAITNDEVDNNETNIICWVDDKLQPLNPSPIDWWWYPMYEEPGATPNGQLVKGENNWTWEITLNATEGEYKWNPHAKSSGWKPINPDMFPYIGDEGANLVFKVSEDGAISGHTKLVIPKVQYEVTLKIIDQTKGEITNKVDDNNETNIFCWIDGNLEAQNMRVPYDWWVPMYSDEWVTNPNGELIKGDNDWTWQIKLKASPGTYSWNPYAKTLGWNPINPGMYAYTGDNGNDLIFTVSETGKITGTTGIVIPAPTPPPPPAEQFQVTLKLIDQTKGEITNKVDDNNETNIICWIDENLANQNKRTPSDWWYPMYVEPGTTPVGELIKGDDDWTWQIVLNAEPGTYKWNLHAKTLAWAPINPGMFEYTGDDNDNNLIFTVSETGEITGHTELLIPSNAPPPPAKFPVTLKLIDRSKGEITNKVDDNNETNIICWIDENLANQNKRTPSDWWYPMYNEQGTTPVGELIKGDDDWTWQLNLNAEAGTYKWNLHAKTLAWAPINPGMYEYTGDDEENNLVFTVSETGEITGHTELVIENPTKYLITLRVIDKTKGEITNDAEANNETNIVCWIDEKLAALNPIIPNNWWYPMYSDPGITPSGRLIKGEKDWTWSITFIVIPGKYAWNPHAKSLGLSPINPDMFAYITGDDEKNNLIFTISKEGEISGHTQLVFSPETGIPAILSKQVVVTGGKASLSAEFEGAADVAVYTVLGTLVKQQTVRNTFKVDNLFAGIYLMKINNKTYKVVVR